MQKQQQNISGKEQYKVIGLISQGLSKNTYLVEGEKSKQRFSMRIFGEQSLDPTQSEIYYQKEIKFINDCINKTINNHDNILNFIDYVYIPEQNEHFLIQEYCEGGSLFNFILKQKNIPQINQIEICLQISKGLQWLHSQNIIHRDLKPESILLTQRNQNCLFKITDFGYSCFAQNQLQSIIGTINYMAPEVLSQNPYSKTVDIWAIGLIMYEIAYRKQLFQSKTVQQTAQLILQFQSLDDQEHQQNDLYQVIKQCLNPDINVRLTIDNVVEMLQQMYNNKIEQAKQQNETMRDSQEDNIQEFNQQFSQTYNEVFNKNEQNVIKHQLTVAQFQQFTKKLGSIKDIAPQQKGFLQKLSLKGNLITPFKINSDYLSLTCQNREKFYCNLFHFILCGKLLGALQQLDSKTQQLFQDSLADPFQEWVMKLIKESLEIDQSIKKDQFKTLYLALSQIANIRDIYFRVNTYLGWLQDDQYLQQSTKLAQFMYERMQQQQQPNNFLPETQVQIIYQDITSALILSSKGGLYDCFIFQESQQWTIIMQATYLNAIQQIEWQSKYKQQEIQDLILLFKKHIINEGFFKQTKQIIDKFTSKTLGMIDINFNID
ncbi:hypothetical protein ABPG72_021061 [Tetrahymena utriculariae]